MDSQSEVFVWTGKQAPSKARNSVWKIAKQLVESRDFWTAPLQREFPGIETRNLF